MKSAYAHSNEAFRVFIEEGASLLMRHGEDKETAERGGNKFGQRVSNSFAGQQIYIPKFETEKVRAKNTELAEEFKQNNQSVQDLAAKHNISTVHAYNILKANSSLISGKKLLKHPIVMTVVIELARMLIAHGVASQDAAEASRGFAVVLLARFGGRTIYFPNPVTDTRERDQVVYEEYLTGTPVADILIKHNLTAAWVRKIITRYNQNRLHTSTLHILKRRILEVAAPYKNINKQIHTLLASAADNVGQAQILNQQHQRGKNEKD